MNTSASSGIDILTQVNISGGRVMTIAADLSLLAVRRLRASKTDKRVPAERANVSLTREWI